jgi:threonine synthase
LLRQGIVKPEETVVLVLTGNLLKDPDYTMEFHRGESFQDTAREQESARLNHFRHPPVVIDATLEAVIKTLEQAEKSDPTHSNV